MSTAPSQSANPPTAQATPTFRKYLTSDASGVQSVVVETSEHVVLTQSPAYTQQGALTVPIPAHTDVNFAVYAAEVTLAGNLALAGRSLAIVTRTLHVPLAAPPVWIDVSGNPGGPPAAKVAAGAASDQVVEGQQLGAVGKGGARGHGILIKREDGGGAFQLVQSATSDGSPGWSASDHPVMHGRSGAAGAPGEAGGAITIVADQVEGILPVLYANGGDGGDGQEGQDGVTGGTGGSGADAQWPDWGDDYAASNGGAAGKGGDAGLGGQGGAGGKAGTITVVVAGAEQALPAPQAKADAGVPGQDGKSGDPGGAGGQGAAGSGYKGTYTAWADDPSALRLLLADGAPGAASTPGAAIPPRMIYTVAGRRWLGRTDPVLLPSSTPDIRIAPDAGLQAMALVASTSWLQLMVEKVRTTYLTTDPADKAGFADLGTEIDWLVKVLSAKDAPGESSDGKQGTESALHNAWTMAQTHLLGQDAFGMAPRWVPTMSVDTYLAQGLAAVATLKDLEQATGTFWSAAAQTRLDQTGLNLQGAQTANSRTQVDDAIATARADIKAARADLDKAEADRTQAKQVLSTALKGFGTAVSETFALDPATLLNCLSQMSFAGGSMAGSAALIASQAGTAALDAAQNLRDDTGQPVNKKYLVGHLTSFIGEEWKASVTENAAGFIDDTSSYAYVDDASRINSLIDTFAQHRDLATDVNQTARALDGYVEMVDRRNRAVDHYNDGIRRLACLTGESDRLAARATEIATTIAAQGNPGAEAWADYYNGLTEQVRLICLDNLARAYRAASFWCLQDVGSFTQWAAGNPGAITATALESAFTRLRAALTTSLENFHRLPNVFPAPPKVPSAESGWTAGGVLVVLTPAAYPWFFERLLRCGYADFELVPAQQTSPAPATHDAPTAAVQPVPIIATAAAPPPGDGDATPNPFNDKANVRLTAVHPWVEGMTTTNDNHFIVMEHRGQERFRTVNDDSFPAPSLAGSYLDHEPVSIAFQYNASAYAFDVHKGFAAAAVQEGEGFQDGSLVFNRQAAEAGAELASAVSYAPIGPFGMWRLHIDLKDNPGADLKKVSRILIDFQGYCDSPFA